MIRSVHRRLLLAALALGVVAGPCAPVCAEPVAVPRWSFEFKGGSFEPDLAEFERFYGDDRASYFALSFSYQLSRYVDVGGEIGRMREKGTGSLDSGAPGGEVSYRLVPAHAFIAVRGIRRPGQLLVPYGSVGLTSAYYTQEIVSQPGRDGRTDIGLQLRIGLRLSLDRLDPSRRAGSAGGLRNTWFFVEAQQFSAEVDGIDLGGLSLVAGFRFDFGQR